MKAFLTWLVNTIIKFILHILLKLDTTALKQVPKNGPFIIVGNHINFLDVPVLITHLVPRPLTGFAKRETWDDPVMAFLFNLWGGIPIDRSGADFIALQAAKKALLDNMIMAVAPEGTRSGDGRLQKGKPGIAILANQSGVPILPIAYYGHENFKHNLRRFKRTPMSIRVGKPFRCKFDGLEKNKDTMQAMTDAIMFEIAALLPEAYRGVYSETVIENEKYLEFLDAYPGEHVPQTLVKQFSHA